MEQKRFPKFNVLVHAVITNPLFEARIMSLAEQAMKQDIIRILVGDPMFGMAVRAYVSRCFQKEEQRIAGEDPMRGMIGMKQAADKYGLPVHFLRQQQTLGFIRGGHGYLNELDLWNLIQRRLEILGEQGLVDGPADLYEERQQEVPVGAVTYEQAREKYPKLTRQRILWWRRNKEILTEVPGHKHHVWESELPGLVEAMDEFDAREARRKANPKKSPFKKRENRTLVK